MKLRDGRSLMLALALLGSSAAQQGAATGEPIVLPTAHLPKAFLRQPYHFKLEAQGGITPLTWEVTNGSPPEGIELLRTARSAARLPRSTVFISS
jgi:hypothetical protein